MLHSIQLFKRKVKFISFKFVGLVEDGTNSESGWRRYQFENWLEKVPTHESSFFNQLCGFQNEP